MKLLSPRMGSARGELRRVAGSQYLFYFLSGNKRIKGSYVSPSRMAFTCLSYRASYSRSDRSHREFSASFWAASAGQERT
jgi:hypothetical protein